MRQESSILKLGFLFFCSALLLSCGPQKHSVQSGEPIFEKPQDPPPSLEEPEEFESPLVYTWFYKGVYNRNNKAAEDLPPLCPENFQVEGLCEQPLEQCLRGESLYACYPKDLELRIQGRVVDEEGNPLRGAQIFSTYPMAGFPDTWQAESRRSGNFLVRTQSYCLEVLSASKDGYVAVNNSPQDTRLSGCKVDNFQGARGLTFRLKKAERTFKNQPGLSTATNCELMGRVVDTDGDPLEGVQVFNGRGESITNKEGVYKILKSEACSRFCTARKRGFRPVEPLKGASAITSCFDAEPADMILKSDSDEK